MELRDIYALIDRFEVSTLHRLALSREDFHLELERGGAVSAPGAPVMPPPEAQTSAPTADETLVRAPILGTFYVAGEPGGAPFVKAGDRVEKGQTLCVLEAMKTLSDLPAPADCTILELLAEDGALVEYGAPLFRIQPLDQ